MRQEELTALLQDMSLEEKVGQMVQLMAGFFQEDASGVLTGPGASLGILEKDVWLTGSILGTYGARELKELQKKYMERHPHHIPLLFMMDVIHGMKTIFPIPLGLGCTFEPELARRCASAAAKEAAVTGLHVTFSPMADLVRDARWGRVMESTGEDPWLNGLFAGAQVEGFQGKDPGKPDKIASCIKHFAAYGAAEAGRDYNSAELCEHTLREFYLPAYRAGIDAGAALVMTSFNTVDGIPATINTKLMRKILREEMEFDGVLISDFSAILETVAHGCSRGERDAAGKAVRAGVDIDMMTSVYSRNLAELARSGELDESLIDECVMRILELKNKLGLFENPYKDADEEREKTVLLCEEHRNLAREAAVKSMVLLKNDGILPVNRNQKIAFVGPYTDSRQIKSSWSFTGDEKDCVTIREAAMEALDPRLTVYACGCPIISGETCLKGFTEELSQEPSGRELELMREEALRAAREADVVIMPLGEHYLQTGEAASRAFLEIPQVQMELFREVCRVNPNVVTVLFNGRPLDLREISGKSRAVLEAWRPGTEGGHAVLDLLLGRENPSGKLSMSMPYCVGQTPVYYNHTSTGRPYAAGIQDRFRSRYLDIPNEPLYPFGYGLSYTTFEISPVELSGDRMRLGETLTARVRVKNTGSRPGCVTVQMYLQDVTASVARPVRELKGFVKAELEPEEEKTVEFSIEEPMLRFWRADGSFASEEGDFRVFVGEDSAAEKEAGFTLLP